MAGALSRPADMTTRFQGIMEWRSVTRLVDDNTYAVEMYGTDKSGKEKKLMEGTYTRKQ
jgi:hypothetical protein